MTKNERFEILKRDRFTCQYCGRSAPSVELEVDHIHPKSARGLDNKYNLITACSDCNRGKGKRMLAENTEEYFVARNLWKERKDNMTAIALMMWGRIFDYPFSLKQAIIDFSEEKEMFYKRMGV